jgi:hypothetical protein
MNWGQPVGPALHFLLPPLSSPSEGARCGSFAAGLPGLSLSSERRAQGCGCETWKQATSYWATTWELPEASPAVDVGFA